ncbi:MAG: CpaF family protein [Coriobacteriia bacterium]|nr:CpaF family protein [Coriobacteriia bacterium]
MRKKIEQLKTELYLILPPEHIASLLAADGDMARKEVKEVLRRLTIAGPARVASRNERERVIALTVSEVLGLGVIDALLADASVTEIMVNGPDRIFFERAGKTLLSPDSYASEEQLRMTIDRIVSPLGRRIDEQNPMVNGRLPAGHRINAVIPPISLSGSLLTIRKFSETTLSLSELIKIGSVNPSLAVLLSWAVGAKQNIAVSGGTGSGKTTLLNALSLEIPSNERIITIEDSAELKFATHPHVLRLEARPSNLEGKGEISLRDLVINSLRMRPDRIVVGEVRGAEALEMLQAMNTGHDGSLTTLHANTPHEVITRLITMVGYGVEQSQQQVEAQISAALDLIVHVQRCADGVRRIVELVELCTAEAAAENRLKDTSTPSNSRSSTSSNFVLRRIYRFEQTGMGDDGRIKGRHAFSAIPHFVDSLEARNLASNGEVAAWKKDLDL